MPPTRDALLQELTREEARLSELEQARTTTQKKKIESLRSELASIAAMQPSTAQRPPMDSQSPRSTADKVRLFRSLFRGDRISSRCGSSAKKPGNPATLQHVPTSGSRAYACSRREVNAASAPT